MTIKVSSESPAHFTRRTGYEHPHLRTVQDSHMNILKALDRSDADIGAELRKLFEGHELTERTS